MITKVFPYNPVISCMEYNPPCQELTIHFKRTAEMRTYAEVPKEIFYGLYYLNTTKELLSYYAKKMRKQFKILTIKPIK